jgi:hypothetical protein
VKESKTKKAVSLTFFSKKKVSKEKEIKPFAVKRRWKKSEFVVYYRKYFERKENKMVKHIILWKLKDEFSDDEKIEIRKGIKSGLEALKGVVPGLVDIHVQTEFLPTSNADVMLDSTFESFEALKNYAVHASHVDVANTKVRPFTASRMCLDFEI